MKAFQVLDFAGHEEYHVACNLFMHAELSIFTVVFALHDKTAQAQAAEVQQHVRYIRTQCDWNITPNVLLVATHLDAALATHSMQEIESGCKTVFEAVRTVFGDAVAFVHEGIVMVDAREGTCGGMHELRNILIGKHSELVHGSDAMVPLLCDFIQRALQAHKQSSGTGNVRWLTHGQYVDVICGAAKRQQQLLEEELQKLEEQYLQSNDRQQRQREVAAAHGFVPSDAMLSDEFIGMATRYLHGIGELYHNEHSHDALRDIVIIDMSWLCQHVLGWLFCPTFMLHALERAEWAMFREQASRGAVAKALIPPLRNSDGNRVAVHVNPSTSSAMASSADGNGLEWLQLLEAFSLCYHIDAHHHGAHDDAQSLHPSSSVLDGSDSELYMFPLLLSATPPRDLLQVWECNNGTFGVHMHAQLTCMHEATTVFPPGYFGRCQVQLRKAIGPHRGGGAVMMSGLIWRHGVWCGRDGVEALVQMGEDGGSVQVHVRGDDEDSDSASCRAVLEDVCSVMVEEGSARSRGLVMRITFPQQLPRSSSE